MTIATNTQGEKRKRSSISSSSSDSQMAKTGPKSESEWDAGSLILSQSPSRSGTSAADASNIATSSKVSIASFPELPRITGDLVLETFTHRSLRKVGASIVDSFPDNERLSEVGEMALNLAVTNYLYHKRPPIEASAIPAERSFILSDENFELWIKHYDIQKQLRYTSGDINTSQEIRTLFNAYVGAVYEEHGMRAVGTWISRLIDPDQLPMNPDDTNPTNLRSQKDVFRQHKQSNNREVKRQKSESLSVASAPDPFEYSGGASVSADSQNTPPPPLPPPLTASGAGVYSSPPVNFFPPPMQQQMALPAYGPPPSGSPPKAKYLPKFNERCSQQKLKVDYKADNLGSAHAPKWVISCTVNGVHKGAGQGSSKQEAKEEAVKQAATNMGWIF